MFDEIMKIINCEDVTAIENAVREMERLVGLGNDKIKSLKDKQFYSECVDNEDDDYEEDSEIAWTSTKNNEMIEVFLHTSHNVNIWIVDSRYSVDDEESCWGLEIKDRSKFHEFADLVKVAIKEIVSDYEPYPSDIIDYLDTFLLSDEAQKYVRVTHYPDDEEE